MNQEYRDYLQSDKWKQKRQEALERFGFRCAVCNSEFDLQVHHRSYARIYNESQRDLTVLCRKCHESYEFRIKGNGHKKKHKKHKNRHNKHHLPKRPQIKPMSQNLKLINEALGRARTQMTHASEYEKIGLKQYIKDLKQERVVAHIKAKERTGGSVCGRLNLVECLGAWGLSDREIPEILERLYLRISSKHEERVQELSDEIPSCADWWPKEIIQRFEHKPPKELPLVHKIRQG